MNSKYSIKIFNNTDQLAARFAKFLKEEINSANKKISLCLSGGSTPKKIYKLLATEFAEKINWKNVQFFWGDERCVPPDHQDSNYGSGRSILFDKLNIPANNIFQIKGENQPEDEAKRYSEIVLNNVSIEKNLPSFDLMMLGIGEDGHTASIFPDQMHLFSSNKICEVANHPDGNQKRITITGRVINNSKKIIFIATGKNKSKIVHQVLEIKSNKNLPAQNVESINGVTIWYLDKDAASLLKNIKEDFDVDQ